LPKEKWMDGYMTYKESADYLRMHRHTLRKHVKSGEVASYKLAKSTLFKKADLDEFMNSRRSVRG